MTGQVERLKLPELPDHLRWDVGVDEWGDIQVMLVRQTREPIMLAKFTGDAYEVEVRAHEVWYNWQVAEVTNAPPAE